MFHSKDIVSCNSIIRGDGSRPLKKSLSPQTEILHSAKLGIFQTFIREIQCFLRYFLQMIFAHFTVLQNPDFFSGLEPHPVRYTLIIPKSSSFVNQEFWCVYQQKTTTAVFATFTMQKRLILVVRATGLEPACLTTYEPKGDVTLVKVFVVR